MTALAKELGMRVGVGNHEDGGAKTSSSVTIRTRSGSGDVEASKQAVIATSRPRLSSFGAQGGENEQDEGNTHDGGGDGDGDGSGGSELKDDVEEDGLTLSRARCIALVATVTGAAFLNVSEALLQTTIAVITTLHHNSTTSKQLIQGT